MPRSHRVDSEYRVLERPLGPWRLRVAARLLHQMRRSTLRPPARDVDADEQGPQLARAPAGLLRDVEAVRQVEAVRVAAARVHRGHAGRAAAGGGEHGVLPGLHRTRADAKRNSSRARRSPRCRASRARVAEVLDVLGLVAPCRLRRFTPAPTGAARLRCAPCPRTAAESRSTARPATMPSCRRRGGTPGRAPRAPCAGTHSSIGRRSAAASSLVARFSGRT